MSKALISSDRDVRNLIARARKEDRKIDKATKRPNLSLRAGPNNVATWLYVKRLKGRKNPYRKAMGRYPALSLPMAINEVDGFERDIASGTIVIDADNSAAKQIKCFRDIAVEALGNGKPVTPETAADYTQSLSKDVYPHIGEKDISVVTQDDLRKVCQSVYDRGARVKANSTRAAIRYVLRYAKERGLIQSDPSQGLPSYGTIFPRDRQVSNDELRAIWSELGDASIAPTDIAIKIIMLTGLRRGTVAGLKKSELTSLMSDKPILNVPGRRSVDNRIISRTKSGKSLQLPLGRVVAALIQDIADISDHEDFVFPGRAKQTKYGHIDPNSITRRMQKITKRLGITDLTPHDMRRAISDNLGKMGTPPYVIDMVLHHSDASTRGRHYPDANRQMELKRAMFLWQQRLLEIVNAQDETMLKWHSSHEDALLKRIEMLEVQLELA
ncbi:MAG: tyrosine-type recombinase/integrase [Methyloligellaceae bacterium]